MDRAAFLRAREHLTQAYRELGDLRSPADHESTRTAWARFLVESQRVYSKLAHGASGPSAAWFGTLKHDRKKDPLLLYAHQARHADEHGIEKVTFESPDELLIKIQPGGRMSHFEIDTSPGEWRGDFEHGASATFTAGAVHLVKVKNEGRWYDPPNEHLGKPIESSSPLHIGELLLAYLDRKLIEAERFVAG